MLVLGIEYKLSLKHLSPSYGSGYLNRRDSVQWFFKIWSKQGIHQPCYCLESTIIVELGNQREGDWGDGIFNPLLADGNFDPTHPCLGRKD